MSPAELTLELLDAVGLTNGATGWLGVYSTTPNTGDQVVTVYDSMAMLDGRRLSPPYTQFLHDGVQIMVRSKKYSTGWDKIKAIVARLELVVRHSEPLVSGTPLYHNYHLLSPVVPAGREETNLRYLFSANYSTVIEV